MSKKIYTKTGDKGRTGTFRGRMKKSDILPETLGTIDELNSWLGVVRASVDEKHKRAHQELKRMQNNLLTIGSGLAGSGKELDGGEVEHLEEVIDGWQGEMPKLSRFILPGGRGGAAGVHVARTIARRTERMVVKWAGESGEVDEEVKRYLNRLSDALFTMARWVNFKSEGLQEEWVG